MISPPLTSVHPHPTVNLDALVTDLWEYLAPANRAGKYLRGKSVGEEGGVGGTIRKRAAVRQSLKVSQ